MGSQYPGVEDDVNVKERYTIQRSKRRRCKRAKGVT